MAKVLIVDDDSDSRTLLSKLLGYYGYETRVARDGESALTEAAEYDPDVVLLDIIMPGMDGFEVAQHLREDHHSAAMIVGMSGLPRADMLHRHRLFDYYLRKPVRIDQIRDLISR